MTWLAAPVSDVAGEEVDVKEHVSDFLRASFTHLRAFHACRPVDVQQYFTHGVRPADPVQLTEHARSLLVSERCPEVSSEAFAAAVAQMEPYTRGEICFFFDDRPAIQESGHYCLYGSEFITSIAVRLPIPTPSDPRQLLKRFGRPTILVCDVPMVALEDGMTSEIGCTMLEEYYRTHLSRDDRPDFSGGFASYQRLEPHDIIDVQYPGRVFDPFLNSFVTVADGATPPPAMSTRSSR